jgi:hypothetical protein
MEEISNKTLAILLICAIVVSLGGTLLSLNKLQRPGSPQITGMATNATSGVAEVTIMAITQIGFTQGSINFGSGFVNDSCTFCQMAATDQGGLNNGGCCLDDSGNGWSDTNNYDLPLILENQGNYDVSLTIVADRNATEWINGTSPLAIYKIISGNNSALYPATIDDTQESCTSGWEKTDDWYNLSDIEEYICGAAADDYHFKYQNSADEVVIEINVTIPIDSIKGKTNVSITFSATSEGS